MGLLLRLFSIVLAFYTDIRNMRLSILCLITILVLCSSCGLVKIGGLTSGYNELTSVELKSIGVLDSKRSKPPKKGLYEVNAGALKKYMAIADTSLVYLWVPYCNGRYCYPLRTFVDYCRQHHY